MVNTAGHGKIELLIFGSECHLIKLTHAVTLNQIVPDYRNKVVAVESSHYKRFKNLFDPVPYHEYDTVTAILTEKIVDGLETADIGIKKGITVGKINSSDESVEEYYLNLVKGGN